MVGTANFEKRLRRKQDREKGQNSSGRDEPASDGLKHRRRSIRACAWSSFALAVKFQRPLIACVQRARRCARRTRLRLVHPSVASRSALGRAQTGDVPSLHRAGERRRPSGNLASPPDILLTNHVMADQLVKHYLGLRRMHQNDPRPVTLTYLCWESSDPESEAFIEHRREVTDFAERVKDPTVGFRPLSYPDLWPAMGADIAKPPADRPSRASAGAVLGRLGRGAGRDRMTERSVRPASELTPRRTVEELKGRSPWAGLAAGP